MSSELKGVYAQRNSPINDLCNWAYDLNSKSKFTAKEHLLYQNTSLERGCLSHPVTLVSYT